jgi:SAM-dependent methyltransferase
MTNDFTKEFFIRSWGPGGYYENFSYGVGIDKVCEVCVYPFIKGFVLEIGSGGGVFTERIVRSGKAKVVTCIDVIPKPKHLPDSIIYIELPDKTYNCGGIPDDIFHFAFAYNVFCHLSNEALTEYIKSVYRVLKPGGDFVFMLSSYGGELGTLLDMGHFAQDDRTIDIVVGPEWEIVSRNMIPEHRDIIVHLKKPL